MQRPKVAHSPRPCSHSVLLPSDMLGFSIRKMWWNIWQSACKTGEVIVYELSVVYVSLFIRLSDYFNSCAIYFWKLDFHPPQPHSENGTAPPVFYDKTLRTRLSATLSGQGPISRKTWKLFRPEGNRIKTCWILAQFLAHKPLQIVSITDSSILLFSKLLKLWSWMQTQNSFPGPESYRDFGETGPRSC